jgi:hypothetical protein
MIPPSLSITPARSISPAADMVSPLGLVSI